MVGDVNHIVIIESLKNERLTGQELYNDCIKRNAELNGNKISHAYYIAHTKDEVIKIIKQYQTNCAYLPGGLLMHFETHGSEDLNGLVLADESLIEWEELADLFRPINITTKNNLFITMATCYGRYLHRGVSPYKKSPYSGFISASKAVNPSDIIDKFSFLFESLFKSGNIVGSYLNLEQYGTDFYYMDSERLFEESFKMTIKEIESNPEYEKLLIEEYKSNLKSMGYNEPTDDSFKKISALVMHDLYNAQKKAFEF